MVEMPGESYRGPLEPLSAKERELRDSLRNDLGHLAGAIGERNVGKHAKLVEAEQWIEKSLAQAGYTTSRQTVSVKGRDCHNIWVELKGSDHPEQIVVVGAHYDTVPNCPGANDNGSGVVAMLALARAMADAKPARTVQFVAFVNEEAPYFQTDEMGSLVYARELKKQKAKVVAMLSLETIGYFTDSADSQHYPPPMGQYYPSVGNFIGFVSNPGSAELLQKCVGAFRTHARFPSEGGAVPEGLPGVSWSDHSSFWQMGWPAIMVTDTAPFRYPHYHQPSDTPDKVDFDRLTRVVLGLEAVVRELVGPGQSH